MNNKMYYEILTRANDPNLLAETHRLKSRTYGYLILFGIFSLIALTCLFQFTSFLGGAIYMGFGVLAGLSFRGYWNGFDDWQDSVDKVFKKAFENIKKEKR